MIHAHMLLSYLAMGINIIGIIVILAGVVIVLFKYLNNLFLSHSNLVRLNEMVRFEFSSYLIFGLEFFIASDVVRTIVIPSWTTLGMLGGIVIIRTILSYFLTKEMTEKEKFVFQPGKEIIK
jgi:uncharacterized membrane protein